MLWQASVARSQAPGAVSGKHSAIRRRKSQEEIAHSLIVKKKKNIQIFAFTILFTKFSSRRFASRGTDGEMQGNLTGFSN